jgi:hypothetical protein
MWGSIDPRRELVYEAVFLVIKAIVEMATDKFGWVRAASQSACAGCGADAAAPPALRRS